MTIRKGLAFLLICLITASSQGCAAARYGKQETEVYYFPECYAPIHRLRQSESRVTKSTAGGALLGAFGGALLGLLTTGEARGAVAGAVIGGAGGAMMGHATAKNAQEHEENRLMYQYIQEIDGDISNLDLVSAAATTSLQCYDRRFRSTVNDYKNGRITRAELSDRYSEIQSGTREASNLLGDAANNGRDMERRYRQALHEGVSPEEQANGGRSRNYAYYGDGYADPYGNPEPPARNYSKPSSQKRYHSEAAQPKQQRTYKSEAAKKAQKKTNDLSRRVDDISSAKRAAEKQTRQQEAEMQAIIASTKA